MFDQLVIKSSAKSVLRVSPALHSLIEVKLVIEDPPLKCFVNSKTLRFKLDLSEHIRSSAGVRWKIIWIDLVAKYSVLDLRTAITFLDSAR